MAGEPSNAPAVHGHVLHRHDRQLLDHRQDEPVRKTTGVDRRHGSTETTQLVGEQRNGRCEIGPRRDVPPVGIHVHAVDLDSVTAGPNAKDEVVARADHESSAAAQLDEGALHPHFRRDGLMRHPEESASARPPAPRRAHRRWRRAPRPTGRSAPTSALPRPARDRLAACRGAPRRRAGRPVAPPSRAARPAWVRERHSCMSNAIIMRED